MNKLIRKDRFVSTIQAFLPLALVVVSLNFLPTHLNAQSKFEFGINVGPSNFLGDLGGTQGKGQTFLKDNNIQMTKLMKGLFVSYNVNPYIGIRAAVNIGLLEGADSVIKGMGGLEEARLVRNQHFKSPLFEANISAELYPTAIFESDPTDVVHKFRPYGIVGIGVFHFNPQAQYIDNSGNAQWVDLHGLRTEGQGMPNHPDRKVYNLTQVNVPYGVGVKYFINETFNLSFEVVNRLTFTDYIDDVSTRYIDPQDFYNYFGANSPKAAMAAQMSNKSDVVTGNLNRSGYSAGDQRGNATNNDAYYATTMKLGIKLGSVKNSISLRHTRCPIVRF
jgi:Domain of unknown function (DUF6089)